MPQIKSSIRSVKTDALRKAKNFAIKSSLKTAARKVNQSVNQSNAEDAKALLVAACSEIDKAVAKGVIHKNAAARKKSRLAHKVNAVAN